MNYEIFIIRHAQQQLSNLPTHAFRRVCDRVHELAQVPILLDVQTTFGVYGNVRRIYVLNYYRLIYEIFNDEQVIIILDIRPRLEFGIKAKYQTA